MQIGNIMGRITITNLLAKFVILSMDDLERTEPPSGHGA